MQTNWNRTKEKQWREVKTPETDKATEIHLITHWGISQKHKSGCHCIYAKDL